MAQIGAEMIFSILMLLSIHSNLLVICEIIFPNMKKNLIETTSVYLRYIDIFHVKELAYIIYDIVIVVMTSQFRKNIIPYKF